MAKFLKHIMHHNTKNKYTFFLTLRSSYRNCLTIPFQIKISFFFAIKFLSYIKNITITNTKILVVVASPYFSSDCIPS